MLWYEDEDVFSSLVDTHETNPYKPPTGTSVREKPKRIPDVAPRCEFVFRKGQKTPDHEYSAGDRCFELCLPNTRTCASHKYKPLDHTVVSSGTNASQANGSAKSAVTLADLKTEMVELKSEVVSLRLQVMNSMVVIREELAKMQGIHQRASFF